MLIVVVEHLMSTLNALSEQGRILLLTTVRIDIFFWCPKTDPRWYREFSPLLIHNQSNWGKNDTYFPVKDEISTDIFL